MSTENLSDNLEGVDFMETETSKLESQGSEENSRSEIISLPLDLSTNVKSDGAEHTSLQTVAQKRASIFSSTPSSKSLKFLSRPVAEIKPFSNLTAQPQDMTKSSLENLNPLVPLSEEPMEIATTDSTIEDSKSRVAVSFLVKKSRGFYGTIRFYLSRPAATNRSKFHIFVSSLKDSVKSTLAKTMPSSKTISQITNTVVNKFKSKRIADCLRFIGFSLTAFNKRKKLKGANIDSLIAISMQKGCKESGTFLNPLKKPELQHLAGFQFAKPRLYECSDCDTRFYKLPIYLKHIRRHAELVRCETCNKAFANVHDKKSHRRQCRQRLARRTIT